MKFIDLFCGIGGFRFGFESACKKYGIIPECVFSSDIDKYTKESYKANFGEEPSGDITKVDAKEIPDHDILFAGFPCQPFSIIGKMRGMEDIRGTLFHDIARVLGEKKPKYFVLENVKQLVGHKNGHTMRIILDTLQSLGYSVQYKVLNALNYGLPQKRERVIIVGVMGSGDFKFPAPFGTRLSLESILEKNPDSKYFVNDRIKEMRLNAHKSKYQPAIWHENKSRNITSYPYSCALRSGGSHNYLLVDGIRRLTPREMLRLQGFPESFKIVVSDSQLKKQVGNAVPVNIVEAVCEELICMFISKMNTDLKNSRL